MRVPERRESGHEFAGFHQLAHGVVRPVRRMRRPNDAVDESLLHIAAMSPAHRRTGAQECSNVQKTTDVWSLASDYRALTG